MKKVTTESVMAQVRAAFAEAGMSLEELGQKMGYKGNQRQSAWQFLNKTADPRLAMLLRFSNAVGTNCPAPNSDRIRCRIEAVWSAAA